MANIVGGAGAFSGPTRAEMEAANAANLAANLQTMRQRQMQDAQDRWNRLLSAKPADMELAEWLSGPGGVDAATSILGPRYFNIFKNASKEQLEALAGAPMSEDAYIRFARLAGATGDLLRDTAPAAPAATPAIPVGFTPPAAAPVGAGAAPAAAPAPAPAPAATVPVTSPEPVRLSESARRFAERPPLASGSMLPLAPADASQPGGPANLPVDVLAEGGGAPSSEDARLGIDRAYRDAFQSMRLSTIDELLAETKSPDPARRQAATNRLRIKQEENAESGFYPDKIAAINAAIGALPATTSGAADTPPVTATPPAAVPAVGPALTADEVARVRALSPEQRKALAAGIRAANPTAPWGYKDDEPWDDRQMAELMRNNPGTIRSLLSSGFAPTGGAADGTLVSASGGATPATPTATATGRTGADATMERAMDPTLTGRDAAAAKREADAMLRDAGTAAKKEWRVNPEVKEDAYRKRLEVAAKYMTFVDPGGRIEDHPVMSRAMKNWDEQAWRKGEAAIEAELARAGYDRAQAAVVAKEAAAALITADAMAVMARSEAAQKTLNAAVTMFDKQWGPFLAEAAKKSGGKVEGFTEMLKDASFNSSIKKVMELISDASMSGEIPVDYYATVYEGLLGFFGKGKDIPGVVYAPPGTDPAAGMSEDTGFEQYLGATN